jgi:hypothetical protein
VTTKWESGLAYQTVGMHQFAISLCTNSSAFNLCPAPPAERCCNRALPSHSKRSNLRITSQAPVSLSSVSLWSLPAAGAAGGPGEGLQAVYSQGVAISVGSGSGTGSSMSGCYIDPAKKAAEGRPGYTAQAVMCGPWVVGTEVVLGLPGLQGGAGLAVQVCTRDANEDGNGNAVLYVAGDMA